MGSVKIDLSKGEKRLEELYPLDTYNGVYALLSNIHHVREMRYFRGDFDACNMLIDLEASMTKSGLSDRQIEALKLFFEYGYRQEEIAIILNISQQGVADRIKKAINRIATYNAANERGLRLVS